MYDWMRDATPRRQPPRAMRSPAPTSAPTPLPTPVAPPQFLTIPKPRRQHQLEAAVDLSTLRLAPPPFNPHASDSHIRRSRCLLVALVAVSLIISHTIAVLVGLYVGLSTAGDMSVDERLGICQPRARWFFESWSVYQIVRPLLRNPADALSVYLASGGSWASICNIVGMMSAGTWTAAAATYKWYLRQAQPQ